MFGTLRPWYMGYVTMLFLLATTLLITAAVQKVKPTFSFSYNSNHKPSYLKAKSMARLFASATMYISGLYLYFSTDLKKTSLLPAYLLGFGIISQHIYRWVLAKVLAYKDKQQE